MILILFVRLIFRSNSDLRMNELSPSLSTVLPQTNALYHAAFEEWAAHFTNVKILSDQTRNNDVNKSFTVIVFTINTTYVACFGIP